mmetsp:Transcript_15139/g.45870  ORF Transcript_15139/g.45870 Transcript_15139/m.45870 type:complete len:175 (+) Transcript_15139:41-565(+)
MTTASWLLLLLLPLLALQTRAHPCDAEALAACPFEGGAALGACLRDPSKHETATALSAACLDFLTLHERCAANLASGACGGTAYTDDALLCLSQWTKRSELSDDCAPLVPEPVVKERVLDAAAQKKRDARKRARNKAADEVRAMNGDPPKTPKVAKKRVKKTKPKHVDVDDTDL